MTVLTSQRVVKERPVLFAGRLVRAILEGRKTQTRRVVRWPAWVTDHARAAYQLNEKPALGYVVDGRPVKTFACPYGRAGDRLWVREAIWLDRERWVVFEATPRTCRDHNGEVWSLPETDPTPSWPQMQALGYRKRPSIHMPRWASRITLEVTGVRVERLQDITEEDAIAEGVQRAGVRAPGYWCGPGAAVYSTPRVAFEVLWDTINGKRAGASFDANPYVWAITFTRLDIAGGNP